MGRPLVGGGGAPCCTAGDVRGRCLDWPRVWSKQLRGVSEVETSNRQPVFFIKLNRYVLHNGLKVTFVYCNPCVNCRKIYDTILLPRRHPLRSITTLVHDHFGPIGPKWSWSFTSSHDHFSPWPVRSNMKISWSFRSMTRSVDDQISRRNVILWFWWADQSGCSILNSL